MPTATANGKRFTFPEGTSQEQMGQVIDEYFGAQEQPEQPEQRLETALPAPVAEFAGAANRSIADTADFFTTGPINTVFDLAGSDFRVPTFREGLEKATGGTSGFMEPGTARNVVQGAGNMAPAFASPIRGVPPAMQGGSRAAKQLLEDAAPSIRRLKDRANSIYGEIDNLGARIDGEEVRKLADSVLKETGKQGLDPDITPKAHKAVQRLLGAVDEQGGTISPSELDTLRKVAGAAARDVDPSEAFLGGTIKRMIDDFVIQLPPGAVKGGDGAEVQRLFGEARRLVQQRKKAELIEQAIDLAHDQATGLENGLRTQFRQLGRRIVKGQEKGFTKAEAELIRKVGTGGRLENVAKALGKFGVSDQQAVQMLIPGLGVAGGAAVGGPAGAVAVPVIGQAFKSLASRLTGANASLASAVVRSGKNGREIVAAYMRAIPKAQRRPEELGALLLEGRMPLPAIQTLQKSENTFVANAAFLAAIAADELDGDDLYNPADGDNN